MIVAKWDFFVWFSNTMHSSIGLTTFFAIIFGSMVQKSIEYFCSLWDHFHFYILPNERRRTWMNAPPADMSKKKWSLRILSLALLQMHNPRTYPIDDDVAALRFPPCLLSDEVNLRNMPSRGKKWLLLDTRNLLTFNLLTLICHEMGLFSLRNYVTTRIPQYTRGKQWIEAIPHCLKITESDTFEFLIFGIFHQFLSY